MKKDKMITKEMAKVMGKIVETLDDCKILSYKLMTLDERDGNGPIRWDSQTTKNWFDANAKKISTLDELLIATKGFKDYLLGKMTPEELEYFEDKSMEDWIKVEFSRKYYNELDNNVELFCERLNRLIGELTNGDTFSVDVYDLSNETFDFGTEEEARMFINELTSPWTLFEDMGTYRKEIACE